MMYVVYNIITYITYSMNLKGRILTLKTNLNYAHEKIRVSIY